MSANQFASTRVKTALDDKRLKLEGDPLEGSGGKAPALTIYFKETKDPGKPGNVPIVAVYTNLPNDKPISAEMGIRVIYEMIIVIRKLVSDPTERTYFWDLKGHPYQPSEGRPSKEPMSICKLYVGRDKDGEIFISLLSYDNSRAKIRFVIRDDKYAGLNLRGGTITKAEVSEICAQAFIEAIKDMYALVHHEGYVHPDFSKNGKGGGGGNQGGGRGNYGNNNSGGNNRGGSDDEDDLPFD